MSSQRLSRVESDERYNEKKLESKADVTRKRILEASFDDIYENGFQGMRIESVLNRTGLAKGALYHHFANKKALGYAVVDEIVDSRISHVTKQLNDAADPIKKIQEFYQSISARVTQEEILRGCPINNLVQEMAGLDLGFKQRLERIFNAKIEAIASALEKGKASGLVKESVDPKVVAGFIISSMNGIIGAGKCTGDILMFKSLVTNLCDYIESLRA